MREIPINLTAAEIRAYQGGETVLRRAVKPQPERIKDSNEFSWYCSRGGMALSTYFTEHTVSRRNEMLPFSPFGAPGDVLVFKEKWSTLAMYDDVPASQFVDAAIKYWADMAITRPTVHPWGRGRQANHLPRQFVRYTPRVLSCMVERRGDTWEWVAVVEGVKP